MIGPSRYLDGFRHLYARAFVIDPGEFERAGLGRFELELEIRIGGNRAFEVAAENKLAVELARESVDDHERDWLAARVFAQTGLHHVRDQRLDVDGVAFLDVFLVEPDAGLDFCHGALRMVANARSQPPQPPIVTLICREAWTKLPSLNLATAITSWVSASRMRVEASGTLADEKRNRITRAFGFAGASTRISCT